jgi:hypothetical protein
LVETLKEEYHVRDIGVDKRIILKLILEKYSVKDLIRLSQKIVQFRTFVTTVMTYEIRDFGGGGSEIVVLWIMALCSMYVFTTVSEKHIVSIFEVYPGNHI